MEIYFATYSTSPQKYEIYPKTISTLFVSPFSYLVDVYLDYISIQGTGEDLKYSDIHESLQKLFHYSGVKDALVNAYQPKIAQFFMENSSLLGISVCFYCETSYINSYGFSSVYPNLASFLINADKSELLRFIRKEDDGTYSDRTITAIFDSCHNQSESTVIQVFDDLPFFKKLKTKKSESLKRQLKNHFDLDHFLPKSRCPIVGLSFFNFVPSCSVCNEKLKGADMIGGLNKKDILKLSPTSDDYAFDDNISIAIMNTPGISTLRMQEHPQDFRLVFSPNTNIYQEIVNEFRLVERYNYHKQEALKLHDLYQDFSDGHISQIQDLFSRNGIRKSRQEIENQIFRGEYIEDTSRIFDKLKKDIKKQSGR